MNEAGRVGSARSQCDRREFKVLVVDAGFFVNDRSNTVGLAFKDLRTAFTESQPFAQRDYGFIFRDRRVCKTYRHSLSMLTAPYESDYRPSADHETGTVDMPSDGDYCF